MAVQQGGVSNSKWIFDKLYGTRFHTAGAELQIPRKVPMRVEPKSYFGEWGGPPTCST